MRRLSIRKLAQFAVELRFLIEPDESQRHPNILYLERALHSSRYIYLVRK